MASGAFQAGDSTTVSHTYENYTSNALMFAADLSDSVYGNSTTVQPSAIHLMPCIKF